MKRDSRSAVKGGAHRTDQSRRGGSRGNGTLRGRPRGPRPRMLTRVSPGQMGSSPASIAPGVRRPFDRRIVLIGSHDSLGSDGFRLPTDSRRIHPYLGCAPSWPRNSSPQAAAATNCRRCWAGAMWPPPPSMCRSMSSGSASPPNDCPSDSWRPHRDRRDCRTRNSRTLGRCRQPGDQRVIEFAFRRVLVQVEEVENVWILEDLAHPSASSGFEVDRKVVWSQSRSAIEGPWRCDAQGPSGTTTHDSLVRVPLAGVRVLQLEQNGDLAPGRSANGLFSERQLAERQPGPATLRARECTTWPRGRWLLGFAPGSPKSGRTLVVEVPGYGWSARPGAFPRPTASLRAPPPAVSTIDKDNPRSVTVC